MAEDRFDSGSKRDRRESQNEGDAYENGMDEDEPDFSDEEGFDDDVDDEELLGDFLRKRPNETDGIDSVIIVDNVPQVGADRLDKLQNVLRKIFGKFGKIVTEHFPKEGDKTKGYIFLEYQSPKEAAAAVKATNGHKLDKQHTFIVNLFSDFERYSDVPDVWEAPPPQPFQDHGNLRSWLLEKNANDQFSVIFEGGEKTSIFSNTPGEPTVMEDRSRWTETYVRWSPQGTYLSTFHARGVALWGGKEFKQIVKFSHPGVQLIDFSPCEKYLVTFSPLPDNKDDPQAIIIWDIVTGQKKRGFHCENASVWPIFKWSSDGEYFARRTPDTLSIYETPSFGLLDMKSLKIRTLQDFAWSPTDKIISYWTPEEQNTPARVTLIKIPSREQICVKNLFTVAECKMHWQKSGDYLCVKVDRYKSKKEDKDGDGPKYGGIYHNFNIFRIREKQIPVDILEIKDSISAFAWEPIGHRFAFIHGETPRICVSFYTVKGGNVELLKTFEKKQANFLFWSPNGTFIVLAGLRSMSGILEFLDTSDMTIMAQSEHFMATDVEWDPTGRYIATGVSWWGHKVDNAYWMWNFQGKLVHKQPLERFCQLLWRPRPHTLLARETLKELKKNMKKYSAKFSLEDKMRESTASKEQVERRRTQMAEYEAWKEALGSRYQDEKDERMKMRNGVDTDQLDHVENFEEEVVEFLVSVEEIILEE